MRLKTLKSEDDRVVALARIEVQRQHKVSELEAYEKNSQGLLDKRLGDVRRSKQPVVASKVSRLNETGVNPDVGMEDNESVLLNASDARVLDSLSPSTRPDTPVVVELSDICAKATCC